MVRSGSIWAAKRNERSRRPVFRKALVCGLGDSGVAAARLLMRNGASVTAIDRQQDVDEFQEGLAALQALGAHIHLGMTHIPEDAFDVAVWSPGIPITSPWYAMLMERGVPVLSELELAWLGRVGKWVAVTGSNGKSTAVKWLAGILRAAGYRAIACGNYGIPVSSVADRCDLDWLVVEVSSFQLETMRDFRAEAAVLLNLHPNHLDRHGTMRAYMDVKSRLFANTRGTDVCVVPADMAADVRACSHGCGVWRTFGAQGQADYVFNNGIVYRGNEALIFVKDTYFDNPVLGTTAAAVTAVALEGCHVSPDAISSAALSFAPLPHRMRDCGQVDGVRFINDSKATNLTAMSAALRMLPGRVRLIAGGMLKERDLSGPIISLLREKVVAVYLIGRDATVMAGAWGAMIRCELCETLDKAFQQAVDDSMPGDIILLSPGTASFDQFQGFEHRGSTFEKMVEKKRRS